jgi:hypothetical protein
MELYDVRHVPEEWNLQTHHHKNLKDFMQGSDVCARFWHQQ